MAKSRSNARRSDNVAVSLDAKHLCRLLATGAAGSLSGEFIEATSTGFVPFSRRIDPRLYCSPDEFRVDYLLAEVLSKYDDGKSSNNKRAAAMQRFRDSEMLCRQTNDRLWNNAGSSLKRGLTVAACIYVAQRKIQRLLGDLDLDEVALGFGWGPGASTRLTRRQSDAWYKFQGNPEATPNCAVFADAVFQHCVLWNEHVPVRDEDPSSKFIYRQTNRVVTVPKNAKTDRTIAIEPDMNLFVQKGFGAVIRSRLKKVGIDLNDQTRNQHLAMVGSMDESLATIDLSMASDTLCIALVEALLPPDWLQALKQCRSQQGVLPSGEIIRYQKFSSMGNGFTFELESLIFWALCSSVADLTGETDRRVSVFGDDIIVPRSIVEPVLGLLLYCGFKTNEEKSFWNGPFRESCGKHYFRGTDVTPFYVRSQIRRLSDVFLLHNNVVRWCNKGSFLDAGAGSGFRDLCEVLRRSAPVSWRRPRIPLGFGDGAFVGSFDECVPSPAPRGFCGWRAKVLVEPRILSNRGGHGRLLKSLFGLERRVFRSGLCERSSQFRRLIDARYAASRYTCDPGEGRSPTGLVSPSDGFRGTTEQTKVSITDSPYLLGFNRKETGALNQNWVPLSKKARISKVLVPQWADLGPWF